MNQGSMVRCSAMVFLLAGAAVFLGCHEATETPVGPGGLLAAAGGGGKPTSGPSVTAADPAYGHQGDVAKRVTITGSGFSPGAEAAWERGGVADPKVQVLSTEYVSSTQLVATITIATNADLDLYDISVTALDRKKGIGFALFEVTQANVVGGTSIFRGVNSNGEVVGVRLNTGNAPPDSKYWSLGSGLVTLTIGTGAFAIDEAGNTITGNAEGGTGGFIPIWTRSGSSWIMGTLPMAADAIGGNGRGFASDALTGNAILIAGVEVAKVQGRAGPRRPMVWRLGFSGWQRVVLASLGTDGNDVVEEISRNGIAVGTSAGRAAVWEPNGAGGYTVSALPGVANLAQGINSAGDLIVGRQNGVAAYYWMRLPSGGWGAAQTLPIPCRDAIDVDDAGRIAANECTQSVNRTASAIFYPPYSAPPLWLGGLGKNSATHVEAISSTGGWLAGQGGGFGVYWQIP